MAITLQWIIGQTGTGATYTFRPKPNLNIGSTAQRTSVLEIPKMDGSVVQTLGLSARKISLEGVVLVYPRSYDNLITAKDALISGIGTGVGQLHIITGTKHVYYIGILDGEIRWNAQTNMEYFEYAFTILCADPVEYTYVPPAP